MKLEKNCLRKLLSMALFLGFLLCSAFGFSQSTITGTVTDANGDVIPGVNVIEKGTTNGVSTDFDGNYSITVNSGATLEFSYVGFVKQEIAVSGQSTINVTLLEDVTGLDEVVVIGYGSVQRKELTSAVTSIGDEDFNQGLNVNPEQLILGKTPGVNINNGTGAPGQGSRVQIRGLTSIAANTQPLYIVDGIPIGLGGANVDRTEGSTIVNTNPLDFINPNDIESISILKGPSAIAIYGTRGANGVILITTKTGNFNQETTVSLGVITSVGNAYGIRKPLGRDEFLTQAERFNVTTTDYGANTDWGEELIRSSLSTQYNFGVSGGSENSNYFASLSWLDEEGVVLQSGQKRLTGRVNFGTKAIDDRLKLDFNVNYYTSSLSTSTGEANNGGGNTPPAFGQAIIFNPTAPVRNEDGSFFEISLPNGFFFNPVAMLYQNQDKLRRNNFLASVKADFDIIRNELSIGTNLSYVHDNNVRDILFPINSQLGLQRSPNPGGFASRRTAKNDNYLIEVLLNYDKSFGQNNFKFTGGYSFQDIQGQSLLASQTGLLTESIGTNIIGLGDPLTLDIDAKEAASNILRSYFGRFSYNYDEKYFLTAVARADGSSRFPDGNEWGFFPSFAFSWRISQEDFMDNSVFNDLKFRAEWGQVGNNAVPGQGQDVLSINQDGSVTFSNIGNPDLTWETTETFNLGLDFSLFDSRLSGSIDWYNKETNDLFLTQLVPGITVDDTQFANVGSMENRGIELVLNGSIVRTDNFSFNLGFNMAFNKNEITSLDDVDSIEYGSLFGPGFVGDNAFRMEVGIPLHSFYGPEYAGLAEDGSEQYLTEDGEVTTNLAEAEQKVLGSAIPEITYAFTPTIKYKNIDFSAIIRGARNFQVADNSVATYAVPQRLTAGNNILDFNLDEPNVSGATVPEFSSRYVFDADFLKIDNLTLGYTFNTDNIDWIKNARIFFTGINLAVFTDYEGSDPEVLTDARNDDNVADVYGVDFIGYPRARTYTIGFNITF